LRTPLAGLKTQAQIALAAHDAPTREGALRQILVSVDRTTRLVRQLLALAKLEGTPSPPLEASGETEAGALLRDIVRQTAKPGTAHVVVDDALDAVKLKGDREALHLMLRNLHENAVEHTVEHAAGGTIAWRRCYGGRSRSGAGSGLGLTIATMAAARAGARLTLENRRDGAGLRATIVWSRAAA